MTLLGFTRKRRCSHCGSDVHLERRRRPPLVRLLSAMLPVRYYWCYLCRRGFTIIGHQ